jgi:hypothetical protein
MTFVLPHCRWQRRSALGRVFGFLGRWNSGLALSIESATSSVAFDVHLEDDRLVNQAVDSNNHHSVVGKNLVPVRKGLIGGDQHGSSFMACADQLEQNKGLGMVLVNVGEIIKDQQVISVELVGTMPFSSSFWPCFEVRLPCRLSCHPLRCNWNLVIGKNTNQSPKINGEKS